VIPADPHNIIMLTVDANTIVPLATEFLKRVSVSAKNSECFPQLYSMPGILPHQPALYQQTRIHVPPGRGLITPWHRLAGHVADLAVHVPRGSVTMATCDTNYCGQNQERLMNYRKSDSLGVIRSYQIRCNGIESDPIVYT